MSLPEFKVSVDTFETVVTLNGRFIGRAWQGSSTAWWVCRYQEDPKQFDDEATAKQHLLGLMKMPLPDWATARRKFIGCLLPVGAQFCGLKIEHAGPCLPDEDEPCCGHHGHICEVSDENDGCCGRCPVWARVP